jgi:hypothetical protein
MGKDSQRRYKESTAEATGGEEHGRTRPFPFNPIGSHRCG